MNRLFMTQFAILGFGVTTTLCPLAKSYASLVIVVVALGLFDGLYVVLIAVLNTDIVGVHKLSAALGSLYGVISFTLALGPPCAGMTSYMKIQNEIIEKDIIQLVTQATRKIFRVPPTGVEPMTFCTPHTPVGRSTTELETRGSLGHITVVGSNVTNDYI